VAPEVEAQSFGEGSALDERMAELFRTARRVIALSP
jgi:hypothetical protein